MNNINLTLSKGIDPYGESFIREITSSSEGKDVLTCIQCGTCTSTCPVNKAYENSPRKLFLMVRNGMENQVLTSATPWVCASCYKCTVNCPAQIKITEVMYKFKRMAMQRNLSSSLPDTYAFYQAFTKYILKYGRSYEIGLMLKYLLFRHPVSLIKQIPVGTRMMFSGAMPLLPHKIRNRKQYNKLVESVYEIQKNKTNNNK